MHVLAVSLLVHMCIISSASWNWLVPAKFLRLGDLHQSKFWSRPFLVQAGTETASTSNVLTKKLSVCEFFHQFVSTIDSNSISG